MPQMKNVTELPKCVHHIAEGTPAADAPDAEYEIRTPTLKVPQAVCYDHFMAYVESRLGSNTFTQLVVTKRAGGGSKKEAA